MQGVNTQLSHKCDKSTQKGIVQNGGVMNLTRHNYHTCSIDHNEKERYTGIGCASLHVKKNTEVVTKISEK